MRRDAGMERISTPGPAVTGIVYDAPYNGSGLLIWTHEPSAREWSSATKRGLRLHSDFARPPRARLAVLSILICQHVDSHVWVCYLWTGLVSLSSLCSEFTGLAPRLCCCTTGAFDFCFLRFDPFKHEKRDFATRRTNTLNPLVDTLPWNIQVHCELRLRAANLDDGTHTL